MPQTLTFAKVFTAEGEKNGKQWKRWDYKTEAGERFVSFKKLPIELGTTYVIEIEGDNQIGSFTEANGHPESSNGSEAVKTAPVASQGDSERQARIHRQTAAKVAAHLLPTFPKAEQSLETFFVVAEKLVDYFENGAS